MPADDWECPERLLGIRCALTARDHRKQPGEHAGHAETSNATGVVMVSWRFAPAIRQPAPLSPEQQAVADEHAWEDHGEKDSIARR